ncbi:MAG TPA: DUF5916 domain-containing protein [Vicinamibacteria bacterium]
MRTLCLAATLCAAARAAAQEAAATPAPPAPPPPLSVQRAAGPITVDGLLDDPGWQGAAAIDRFYETQPGDNLEPPVGTVAWVAYDEGYFYIAVKCLDPDPGRIRAPFVERDNVLGTDDNVAIFLDTRNDRRSAVELRVNPRGIQGDAVFSDANFSEDFSPDFYYDSAARITAEGWQAELRVPFSTLRYPSADPQDWGIRIWRNYPREFRYAIYSTPEPRGSNCYVCHLATLTGLRGLPTASSLLFVPYATGQHVAEASAAGEPLGDGEGEADAGLDLKWTPSAESALDLTVNPDFSQVEADVAQIATNERFALFYPEKRPFFLEGVDLFATPIQAVYSRTITSPRGGLRLTGKRGRSSYTGLVSHDRGGGLVVLPGPLSSGFAAQDYESWVGIGRVRHDLGRSFVGVVATGRVIDGGGHNWVAGPDFQWRSARDRITGQLLWGDTRTPVRPDLAAEWDGRYLGGHALSLDWDHDTRTWSYGAEYRDFGDGFRDDQGFVPQVGYRQGEAEAGYSFWPEGFLRLVRPYGQVEYAVDREGELVAQRVFPGVFIQGGKNLALEANLEFERAPAGGRNLSSTQLSYFLQLDPSRAIPRVVVQGFVGEDIDVEGGRVGTGASVQVTASIRPDPHLTFDLVAARRWLDVPTAGGPKARLFTADVQRLKATWSFNARAFLRLIGQYLNTENDPSLYPFPVAAREAGFSGSALFSYRLNWQTALFVGYGDERGLDEAEDLRRVQRSFFVKLSYAIQR